MNLVLLSPAPFSAAQADAAARFLQQVVPARDALPAAAPGTPDFALTADRRALRTTLPASLSNLAAVTGVAEVTAAVLSPSIDTNSEWYRQIERYCAANALDCAVVPARSLSDFRLLAMDMDSTLITIECIDEIADFCGKKDQVAAITEAAMRGEITDFKESLRRRVALLAGLEAKVLDQVYDERVQLSPGAERLIETAQRAGLKTLLVSGGFTYVTARLQARLGLDETHANTLDILDGKLTGRVTGEIVDGPRKAYFLENTCRALGVPTSRAMAMGDGANDLPMMARAGLSVAYRAKPAVREAADVAFNHVGLDGVLNLFEDLSADA